MPKNLLWLILFLLPCFSTAQRPDLLFHSLSVSDGLSENTVRSIIEDKMGYMWFASEDGLNKYNGYNFTVYRKDPTDTFSISNRNIKALFIDSKNTFWVLTSNGLNIYDAELDIFYNYRNNKYPALKRLAGDMEGMVEDKNGNFWVLTRDEGLFHISSLDQPPVNYPNIYNGSLISFKSIQLESDSMLLIGSRDGLFKFNCNTKKYIDFRPEYGQGYEINSMLKDSMNNIWLCSSHGLKLINSKGEFKQYLHNPADSKSINGNNIGDILLYKDNQYLVSIDGGGIDLFDYATSEFYHYQNSIPTPNIACLYKAPKGDLWVGTFLNGIYFSNPTTNLFKLIKNSPNATNGITKGMVTRFLKDSKGNLWLATDGGGVYKKRAGTEYFINYKEGEKGLTSNVIISIREDSEGFIWLTTYGGGVCKYDPAKDLFKAYRATPKSPNSLLSDLNKDIYEYDKKMWITGYGNGITLLDKKNETFSYLGNDITNIASNWVQTFLVDKENTLWLATFSGLCKYDLSTNTFKNYVFKNSGNEEAIDLNMIVDLVEDKNGDLWLGTMGNGLIYFNTTDGSYTIYTMKEGLSNNFIKSLVFDNYDNLWMATNNGVTRFNIETRKAKSYTIKDGLPSCSFYFNAKYKDESGKIYFGTTEGYLLVNTENIITNQVIPPIVITEFKINNETIQPSLNNSILKRNINFEKEITLPYNYNSLTFEFAALNYNSSRNNNYAYYLEGFDKTWIMSGTQRTATYTNLDPGTYKFHVKGSNNDNIWNEQGRTIIIKIIPPFWDSWIFISLSIAFGILLIYGWYYWRVRSIRYKNMLLEEAVRQRTKELNETNEQLEAFVYKASHDIKGPLKSIIGLMTLGMQEFKDENVHNYFKHVLKTSKKLEKLLLDLLEITRVKQVELNLEIIDFREMIDSAIENFHNFPGFDKMQFHIDIDAAEPFYSDKKLLYPVIQNLVENPIKYADFTKDENLLHISITTSKSGAELIFKDNGIGIHQDYQDQIFNMFFKANENSSGSGLGLYIVKTTIEKLKGKIKLTSQPGVGSTFIVHFDRLRP